MRAQHLLEYRQPFPEGPKTLGHRVSIIIRNSPDSTTHSARLAIAQAEAVVREAGSAGSGMIVIADVKAAVQVYKFEYLCSKPKGLENTLEVFSRLSKSDAEFQSLIRRSPSSSKSSKQQRIADASPEWPKKLLDWIEWMKGGNTMLQGAGEGIPWGREASYAFGESGGGAPRLARRKALTPDYEARNLIPVRLSANIAAAARAYADTGFAAPAGKYESDDNDSELRRLALRRRRSLLMMKSRRWR